MDFVPNSSGRGFPIAVKLQTTLSIDYSVQMASAGSVSLGDSETVHCLSSIIRIILKN